MEWIAYCTVCGELDRAPNGAMMESLARIHRRDTGHTTIIGHEPSIIMSGEMVEVKVGEQPPRPFPETISDWTNLALDIKEELRTDDFDTMVRVNKHLNHIYEEEQNPEVAQESKRWLVSKAGELGIRQE